MSLRRVHTAVDPTAALRSEWTPAQAAEFAARRDFLLLQHLSKDRRALAAARRCGYFRRNLGFFGSESVSSQRSVSTSKRCAAQTQTTREPQGTARQRRSRRRAAVHHAALEAAAAAVQLEKPDAPMPEAPAPPPPPPAPPPAQQVPPAPPPALLDYAQIEAVLAHPAGRDLGREAFVSDAVFTVYQKCRRVKIFQLQQDAERAEKEREGLTPKSTDSTHGAQKMNL